MAKLKKSKEFEKNTKFPMVNMDCRFINRPKGYPMRCLAWGWDFQFNNKAGWVIFPPCNGCNRFRRKDMTSVHFGDPSDDPAKELRFKDYGDE